jgi:phenylalanyl-tRNA synthetase beta chain
LALDGDAVVEISVASALGAWQAGCSVKVTYNWLKEYVDFAWTTQQLAERLTMLGIEVEGVHTQTGAHDGVVVARVITRDKHPNADKLSLCRVQDGNGERQIVCGAQNFKPGDKVPLILPGAALPAAAGAPPTVIKVGKIRGAESHGMLCSGRELGLSEDAEGLLILRPDAVVGQPFAAYLGLPCGDTVYDLEITPNRCDLNSVIGVAREIAAITGNPLRLPDAAITPSTALKAAELVAVRIEAPELCPRYVARVLRGARIGPSPAWLRQRLEHLGLRSINNVVDVTNFVMLETGQPLHAFDYALLARDPGAARPAIVVRRALDAEAFSTLDGQSHTLRRDMLLIADEQRAIALAGVMGGLNTEIQSSTTDILLESATFAASNIRRTSKTLGLRTDASYRFERGIDVERCEAASLRAAALIQQCAGAELAAGAVDVYPEPRAPLTITLRFDRTNALLGMEIPPAEQVRCLAALGLTPAAASDQPSPAAAGTFRVPSFRLDLKRETDLIEEVVRMHGLDRVAAAAPRCVRGEHGFDAAYDTLQTARRLLSGLGLTEAQGQTLVAEASALLAARANALVRLANPLSADMSVLRPSLLPGLLDALKHNLHHKSTDAALFELGRVFLRGDDGVCAEHRRLAIAMTGRRSAGFWQGAERAARADFFDLKGMLEEFLVQFGVRGVQWTKRPGNGGLFLESAQLALGGKLFLGEAGQLLPALAKRYDTRDAVFLAELDLGQLLTRRSMDRKFQSLPAFPSIRRDLAMIVPEEVTHDAVVRAARQARPANLEAIELFDVFRGQPVSAGHKSVAYAFTYRAADRTLTDPEVNAAHERLLAHLKQAVGAVIRDK